MAPGARGAGLADRTFSSLRVPAYRRYFVGHVSSLLGFWIRIVVQGWLVWVLTGSKEILGMITAVGLLPFLVFSLWGGVLADRVDRRLFLMTMPLVAVAMNVLLGVLVLTGAIEVWHVFATATVIGSARALEIPVRNAFVRDLAGLDELPNAVALNAAGFNVARVAGPAVGALLLPWIGIGASFLVAAALNATMIVALAGVHVVRTTKGRGSTSALAQLAEGMRYVKGHRRTRTLLLLLSITLVFTWAYQTLMPAFAGEQLGLGDSGYALLMATIGVGALTGALFVAGRTGVKKHRRPLVFGFVWMGALCVFALGFVHRPGLAVPLLIAAGFCQVAFIAMANGMVQESVPDALRGRVMGLWTFTFGASFPIGSLLMGTVSQRLGINAAWSGGAALMIVLSLVVYVLLPPRSVVEAEARAETATADRAR